jgi:hypothetical protein
LKRKVNFENQATEQMQTFDILNHVIKTNFHHTYFVMTSSDLQDDVAIVPKHFIDTAAGAIRMQSLLLFLDSSLQPSATLTVVLSFTIGALQSGWAKVSSNTCAG